MSSTCFVILSFPFLFLSLFLSFVRYAYLSCLLLVLACCSYFAFLVSFRYFCNPLIRFFLSGKAFHFARFVLPLSILHVTLVGFFFDRLGAITLSVRIPRNAVNDINPALSIIGKKEYTIIPVV